MSAVAAVEMTAVTVEISAEAIVVARNPALVTAPSAVADVARPVGFAAAVETSTTTATGISMMNAATPTMTATSSSMPKVRQK